MQCSGRQKLITHVLQHTNCTTSTSMAFQNCFSPLHLTPFPCLQVHQHFFQIFVIFSTFYQINIHSSLPNPWLHLSILSVRWIFVSPLWDKEKLCFLALLSLAIQTTMKAKSIVQSKGDLVWTTMIYFHGYFLYHCLKVMLSFHFSSLSPGILTFFSF